MPKVSINILTRNRCELLQKALLSVERQSFTDYEIVLVNDGSTDNTGEILANLKIERLKDLKIITHTEPKGITAGRQEALQASKGKYVAILDDDDEWVDRDKLKKQVAYLDTHPETVLVGGAIQIFNIQFLKPNIRPETDGQIRKTMLLRNNFFTSTVAFRRQAAIEAGGFAKDRDDFAEDYDLWLRMGRNGEMYNFQKIFANYRQSGYNKEKFKGFLRKQLRLIKASRRFYGNYWLAAIILRLRIIF